MGNLLVGIHPLSLLSGEEKVHYHDNRRMSLKPSPYHNEQVYTLRTLLEDMKTSPNEFVFLGYRALLGGLLGFFGGLALQPLLKSSPYVYRKMTMSFHHTELFPFDHTKFMFRTISPYYIAVGAVSGTVFSFISEGYDRAFCTNKFTKFGILGAVDATLLALFVGPIGSWTNAAISGAIFGLALCACKNRPLIDNIGNYGNPAEYMTHVTAEEKANYKLQEERIMGFRDS